MTRSDYKKREPQWLSYAILIGGDEGTRTPGLLTARNNIFFHDFQLNVINGYSMPFF